MKWLKLGLLVLIFTFGFVIGIVYKDIPNLKLNTEVKIFEPLTFLLTVTIGILIPFFIKRWIDDGRQIKNSLIEELKDTLKEVEGIKDIIKLCFKNKSLTQNDKQEIIALFEQADQKIYCLEQLFVESFDTQTKFIRLEINDEYMDYWKLTTGDEIMSSSISVLSEEYYKRHNERFTKFETRIKQAINKVHRL